MTLNDLPPPRPLKKVTRPEGLPAIIPHLDTIPSFTVDDVRQYISQHRIMYKSVAPIDKNKISITKIEFLTSKQASDKIHSVIGLDDNELVCYVELAGSFAFSGPPNADGSPGSTAPYSVGIIIFDAHTGNLLIEGGRP